MKYTIYALFLFLACSCQNESKNNAHLNNWYSCDHNGNYHELHVSKEYFYSFSKNSIDIRTKFFYNFSNDTITYSLEPLDKTETAAKAMISFISDTEMKWQWVPDTLFEPITFKRLEFTVIKFPDEKTQKEINNWSDSFRKQFNERQEIMNCPDLRTKEEILQDSLWQIKSDSITKEALKNSNS